MREGIERGSNSKEIKSQIDYGIRFSTQFRIQKKNEVCSVCEREKGEITLSFTVCDEGERGKRDVKAQVKANKPRRKGTFVNCQSFLFIQEN